MDNFMAKRILLGVLIILLLCVVVFIYIMSYKLKKNNKKLQQQNMETNVSKVLKKEYPTDNKKNVRLKSLRKRRREVYNNGSPFYNSYPWRNYHKFGYYIDDDDDEDSYSLYKFNLEKKKRIEVQKKRREKDMLEEIIVADENVLANKVNNDSDSDGNISKRRNKNKKNNK
jgi:hypothetical protein